jgi:hypothetical protein
MTGFAGPENETYGFMDHLLGGRTFMTKRQTSDDFSTFVDRRSNASTPPTGAERRQFANRYDELSPEARELASAIDEYKLNNRRRFITYEEMLTVIRGLGYSKPSS